MIFVILFVELVLLMLYRNYNKKLHKLAGTGRMSDITTTSTYKKIIEVFIFVIPIVFILVKINFL